jgi:hypothetical protein
MTTDIVPYNPPKLLTEREVRLAGATSIRLGSLRDMLKEGIAGANLTVSLNPRGTGTVSLVLTKTDGEAILAFLKERDELFLTGLNIELEQ